MNKKIECIFYFVDNILFVYNVKTKEISKYVFTNYICDGRIIKPKILIKRINNILKNNKLTKIFANQHAIIIYGPNLKYIDKKIILDVFLECNFKDIKLINTKNLVDNKPHIEINDNYLIYYKDKKYTFIKFNEFINIQLILKLILKKEKNNVLLLGINPNINNLSKIDNKLLFYENFDRYYIDKIIKRKI
ncbi:MAG: hypothetical protein E7158_02130 [Firmicutes bacterium]|nr:hypothetical protein [Bacillota bacterium]